MNKINFLTFFLLITVTINGQQVVTDHANEGQLKTMVYEQWDDWQPNPNTNWLGIPKNFEGYIWWNWIYPSYYHGEDQRPFRLNGPFVANTASLTIQTGIDADIQDTTNAINNTNLATFINMSGGTFDVPYEMYFKKEFFKLTTVGVDYILKLSTSNKLAYTRLVASKVYADYMEELDIQTSRIATIHNSFVEKGARIIAYLDVKKRLGFSNEVLQNYIANYLPAMSLPDTKAILNSPQKPKPTDDALIIKNIMSTYKF